MTASISLTKTMVSLFYSGIQEDKLMIIYWFIWIKKKSQVDEGKMNYYMIQIIPTKNKTLYYTTDLGQNLESKKFDRTTISQA